LGVQNRRSGKVDIRTEVSVNLWLQAPAPAVFLRLDLSEGRLDARLANTDLSDCSFLGCQLGPLTSEALPRFGAFRIDALRGLPFDPFRAALYSPTELYDRFDPENTASYESCFDRQVYRTVSDPATHVSYVVDVDVALMRRLHDAAIGEALAIALPLERRKRCVAVMGGHDEPRNSPTYRSIVELTRDLTREGFIIATGGGPGIMEAANMGAYLAGFTPNARNERNAPGLSSSPTEVVREEDQRLEDDQRLEMVLALLGEAPDYGHARWLSAGFEAWTALGQPHRPELSASFGIPTWFYGHEPPNVFATHIAKYFENSLREEGLLAIALGGVIFAPGNAGTVQEIFQDACQNYYRTYDDTRSPMILLGTEYWRGETFTEKKAKPVEALLRVLATEKGFASLIHTTDDPNEIKSVLLSNQVNQSERVQP
jgi:predicted Rossmann-fold nucleotide-binding protein